MRVLRRRIRKGKAHFFSFSARRGQWVPVLLCRTLQAVEREHPYDLSEARDERILGAVPGMPQLPDGTSL